MDLEAIKTRVAAATPEPWIYSPQRNQDNSYEDCPIHRPNPRLTCSGKVDPILYGGDGIVGSTESLYVTDADAEFIAHAREDVPALIAKLEQERQENERLRTLLIHIVEIGQRQDDGSLLQALGFDLMNTKWRFGFDGWERQADEAQAGCFPAVDWIDTFIALDSGKE